MPTGDVVGNWVGRVLANGGAAPSSGTQSAHLTFYRGLLADNIVSKMKVVLTVSPDNLIAATTPFLNPGAGADPWTNHNFLSGDLTTGGLIGNGTSKFLDSGLIPSAVFSGITDGGLTVYASANNTNASESDFNVSQGSTQAMALYVAFAGSAICDMYSQSAGSGRITATNTSFLGYLSANRGTLGSSVIEAIYKGNSSGGHSTLASSTTSSGGSLPTLSLYAFAQHTGSGAIQFSVKRFSFFAIHSGLTATESSNFYSRIQALRTALGGGFV